jgi:hypothetical protein
MKALFLETGVLQHILQENYFQELFNPRSVSRAVLCSKGRVIVLRENYTRDEQAETCVRLLIQAGKQWFSILKSCRGSKKEGKTAPQLDSA